LVQYIQKSVGNLAASAMAKLSCNINTNKIEKLVFNSDSEEQCTLNVTDIEHQT
jgi:hypothetical protein